MRACLGSSSLAQRVQPELVARRARPCVAPRALTEEASVRIGGEPREHRDPAAEPVLGLARQPALAVLVAHQRAVRCGGKAAARETDPQVEVLGVAQALVEAARRLERRAANDHG